MWAFTCEAMRCANLLATGYCLNGGSSSYFPDQASCPTYKYVKTLAVPAAAMQSQDCSGYTTM